MMMKPKHTYVHILYIFTFMHATFQSKNLMEMLMIMMTSIIDSRCCHTFTIYIAMHFFINTAEAFVTFNNFGH